MYTAPDCTRGGWYGYRVQYYAERFGGLSKEEFIAALRAEGVEATTERYKLLHSEPVFHGYNLYGQPCPYSCRVSRPKRVAISPATFQMRKQSSRA